MTDSGNIHGVSVFHSQYSRGGDNTSMPSDVKLNGLACCSSAQLLYFAWWCICICVLVCVCVFVYLCICVFMYLSCMLLLQAAFVLFRLVISVHVMLLLLFVFVFLMCANFSWIHQCLWWRQSCLIVCCSFVSQHSCYSHQLCACYICLSCCCCTTLVLLLFLICINSISGFQEIPLHSQENDSSPHSSDKGSQTLTKRSLHIVKVPPTPLL